MRPSGFYFSRLKRSKFGGLSARCMSHVGCQRNGYIVRYLLVDTAVAVVVAVVVVVVVVFAGLYIVHEYDALRTTSSTVRQAVLVAFFGRQTTPELTTTKAAPENG